MTERDVDNPDDGDYSLDPDDQLQPEDTLVDRGVDDVLDEGYSPPDHRPSGAYFGLSPEEQRGQESLDRHLAEEEPDPWNVEDPIDEIEDAARDRSDWRSHESDRPDDDGDFESADDDQVGGARAGRLVAPDRGSGPDVDSEAIADDVGIDGAGASAEEAAVHYIDEEN